MLIRHATTEAVRRTAFPLDEPLDPGGLRAAAALAGRAGRGTALCSPALRARATAAALGLDPTPVRALAECDFGTWAGRTLAGLHEEDPEATAAWMTDARACPHGGESLVAFADRVATWLDGRAADDGRTIAVTHGGVVKAAVVRALGAPLEAFWRIDAAPLRCTELHAHDGRWTLASVNAELAA